MASKTMSVPTCSSGKQPTMRCRYCGTKLNPATTVTPLRQTCPTCTRLAPPVFVVQQGDGISSFREVMIAQNVRDLRRKLLETRAFHFTIFLDDDQEIIGFD